MDDEELSIHEERTATFQYSPDLTGIVAIQDIAGGEVEVDMDDLISFVAEAYVRKTLIKCIEATPAKDLLLNQLNPL